MNNLFRVILFVIVSFIVVSCLSENSKDIANLKQKETLFAAKHDSIKLALDMDISYKTFIRKYPSDTNLPRFIFEDAQLNIYPLKRNEAALGQLEVLYAKYPDSRFAANALFKAAFLDENVMGRTEIAKRLYQKFIDTYPTNPLANDAKLSLENINLSPAEQLKKIQAKQDSLSHAASVQK